MSKKRNGVNYGKTVPKQSRRRRVLERLQQQLASGFKNDKDGKKVELSEKDELRIAREIESLKFKLK